MEENEFYNGLIAEKYNYEARIVPREKISDVLIHKIIKKAKIFVCLITPYWTRAGVNSLGLLSLLRNKKDKIKIYLFSRYDATPTQSRNENIEIFKEYFYNLGIRNCWLVRNLHGKLYYNEKYILLTSANFTTTSLGFAYGGFENNFEEGVLLKLKWIKKDEQTKIYFSNINPFRIPPFYYLKFRKNLSDFPKNRFLLGCGYHTTSEIEIPSIFSFPEMMKDWLLSVDTIESYNINNIQNNKLIHLGESEALCPVCRSENCKFSRTYICHKYGIEYPEMVDHCSGIFECEKGPFFKTHEFYKMRCPITVFYCPSKNIYYDPAKDKFREASELISGNYARNELFYQEIGHPEAIENIVIYCPQCKKILEETDFIAYFSGFDLNTQNDYELEIYKCTKCNNYRLKECPYCDEGFTLINIEEEYYYCEKRNEHLHFRIEKVY